MRLSLYLDKFIFLLKMYIEWVSSLNNERSLVNIDTDYHND